MRHQLSLACANNGVQGTRNTADSVAAAMYLLARVTSAFCQGRWGCQQVSAAAHSLENSLAEPWKPNDMSRWFTTNISYVRPVVCC